MSDFIIPNTPCSVKLTGISGEVYDFDAYNIEDVFPVIKLQNSIVVVIKQINSLSGVVDSSLVISAYAIHNEDEEINDQERAFMILPKSREQGARHFFYKQHLGQESRLRIIGDLTKGGHYDLLIL